MNANEATLNGTTVVEREWPSFGGNPKEHVLLRRRKAALNNLESFRRHAAMYADLISRCKTLHPQVLEVASGTGFYSLELARHGAHVTALEIDPNLTEITNGIARHLNLTLKGATGDACAIPFPDNSFDLVLSKSFFEHVYDVDLALREQIRVLKPGGILVVEDGNFLNPKLVLDLLFLYPLRTKGKRGGLLWLMTKTKVHKNLYGYLPLGRDEDVKTPGWWRKKIGKFSSLKVRESGTTAKYTHPALPAFLRPFVGACLLVAEKE